jgi:hypothetical protein
MEKGPMTEATVLVTPPEQLFTWSVVQNDRPHGPYSRNDMLKLILSKQLKAHAKVKRSDWEDYKSIIECLEIIGRALNQPDQPKTSERRMAAPRTSVNGIVSASNDQAKIACLTSNLSISGMFLKTGETCFRIGDKIQLHAKVENISKPFIANAEVMRFSTNLKFGVGYGLRFITIDNSVISEIQKIVGVRPISEFGDFLSSPALRAAPNKT